MSHKKARKHGQEQKPRHLLSPVFPHHTSHSLRPRLSSAQPRNPKPREPPLTLHDWRRGPLCSLISLRRPRLRRLRLRGRARCPSLAPGRSRPPRACCGPRSRSASSPWPCTRRSSSAWSAFPPILTDDGSWGPVGRGGAVSRGGVTRHAQPPLRQPRHPPGEKTPESERRRTLNVVGCFRMTLHPTTLLKCTVVTLALPSIALPPDAAMM